jgi:hypothetical protein
MIPFIGVLCGSECKLESAVKTRPAEPYLMGHVGQELRFTAVSEFGRFSGGGVLLNAVAQIEDHLVDLRFQRIHFATGLDGDKACEISIHGGSRYLSEATHLGGQITGHGIDRHSGVDVIRLLPIHANL